MATPLDPEIQALLNASSGAAPSAAPAPQAPQAPDYTSAAAAVTPQGSNRLSTYLQNVPAAAGGELYRLYKGLRGQPLDPAEQAVYGAATKAAPGAATAADFGATLPAAMGAEALAPAVGLSRLAASASGMGAAQGGLQGLLTANPGERTEQGVLGAGLGAAFPFFGSQVGKLARGLAATPAAQTLIQNGINLPLGMLKNSGAVNKIEQALTHLPFLGSKIANARAAVPEQVTQRMLSDAAAPGASVTAGSGLNDAVSQLQSGYDSAYAGAVGGYPAKASIMRTQGSDIPLSDAFNSVTQTARPGLTPQARASLGQTLQDQLQEVITAARQKGGLEATDLQQFRSTLRTLSREAPEGTTRQAVKSFWDDAQDKVTQALESQLPPKAAAALRAIDAQFGKFATVRDLAVSVKDRTPTMNDWSQAIKNATPPNVYASGGGWNRDLVQAAAQTVKPTVAHTGALGAGTVAPIVAALEAAMHPSAIAAHPVAAGGVAGLLGSLYGAYTKPGMRALAGQTAPQKFVTGLLNQVPPSARFALRGLLTQGALNSQQGLLQSPSE